MSRSPFWRRAGAGAAPLLLAAAMAAVALLAAAPAPAAQRATPAFGAEDKADIGRIESYLNGIKTMQSRFLQVATDGSSTEGTISLSRPGKMRVEYDPPNPVLIVADGRYLIYFDRELEQVSYLGLDDTPAGFLLQDKIRISGEVAVEGIERRPGVISVTVAKSDDPGEGRLTLVFSDKPLALKKWVVVDHQGVTTNFSLLSPRFGLDLGKELFEFDRPKKPEENR